MSDPGTAAASVARLGLLQLVALKGASAGECFETAVPGQPVTIGRKPTNDFVLKDDTVSREHAVIEPTPQGWRITARKREALLMCAGQVVPEDGALLADGDEVHLGLAVIKVTIAPVVDEEEDVERTVVFRPGDASPSPPSLTLGDDAPRRRTPAAAPGGEAPPAVLRAEPPLDEPAAPRPQDQPPAAPVRRAPVTPARRAAPPRAAEARARPEGRAPRERFGRFDVFEPLHESDAWRVERAADAQSGDLVTLRRLLSPQLGFFARRRFLRAVDRLRGITHPNLLAPRETGRAAGDLFMVYPWASGVTAGVVLREGRRDLPIDLAVWIACEVARGLAHGEQNAGPALRLAVGEGEVVCRRDGSVALLLTPVLPVPLAGDRYGAPEEHSGGAADVRAAIFSLGVLLWELLAREPVVPGQQTRLRSVDAVRIQVPPTLAAVTMRAVELRPEDRFGHAAELADALADELERLAPGYGCDVAARWLGERVPDDEEGEPR